MNLENKIFFYRVLLDNTDLSNVIKFSVGNSSDSKLLDVIKSYNNYKNQLFGAYLNKKLIGVVGIEQIMLKIRIRHISVLPEFRRLGIGRLLLKFVKDSYASLDQLTISAETDEEALGFYLKSGYSCVQIQGQYKNIRYSCLLKG
jgi:ribosomal protein S18 acetylase RimI-like enzyme